MSLKPIVSTKTIVRCQGPDTQSRWMNRSATNAIDVNAMVLRPASFSMQSSTGTDQPIAADVNSSYCTRTCQKQRKAITC
eukprot:2397597-Amphidinium_carterae.1